MKRRKKKFSSNWKKLNIKRKDYIHKETTKLANNHRLIFLENLKTKNMTKSAKWTKKNPGKNIKQKSGLNRSVLAQGWHMFQTLLKYKMKLKGGMVIYLNPKNTSIKCCRFHHISKENRKSQEIFKCQKCSLEMNADLNASINILAEGFLVIASGVVTLVPTMKLELEMRNPILEIKKLISA